MKLIRLFKVEIRRLILAPSTSIFFIIACLCPLLGYKVVSYIQVATVADKYMANPFWIGGLGASFLLTLLALYTFSRVKKNQMEHIMYSIISSTKLHIVQIISLLILAFIWTILIALIYLPYTTKMMGKCFFLREYISFFFIFYWMTITLFLIIAACIFNLTKQMNTSAILVVLLTLIGLSSWKRLSYLSYLSFVDCSFSSDFGNYSIYRMIFYSRFLWLFIFSGLWFLSLLFIRTHGKGFLGSMICNIKKLYLLIPALLLIGTGTLLFLNQPYIDLDKKENCQDEEYSEVDIDEGMFAYTYSDEETDYYKALTHTDIDLKFDCNKGTMTGTATYKLENLLNQEQECTLNTALGCEIKSITVNGATTAFTKCDKPNIYSGNDFTFMLPATWNNTVQVTYKQTQKMVADGLVNPYCEITPEYIFPNILVPVIPDAETESATYSCNATIPKRMELIVKGFANKQKQEYENELARWTISGDGAGPSFIAGNYIKLPIPNVDFPVIFYYGKNHQKEFEELNIEQLLQDTIRYCCDHYGSLQFTEEYPLNIVMTSAHMMGGAAAENLSYMGESFFSSINLNDLQRGASAKEVIAHEIIHQWWGVQTLIMDPDDSCWTPEAFTCYATSRLMEELYGADYAKKYYTDKWESDYQSMLNHFYIQNPKYQSLLSKYDQDQLEAMVCTTNVYSKGPLMLKQAEQLVGDEEQMDKILMDLFEKCQSYELPCITKQDFFDACNINESNLQLEGEN